MKFSRSIKDFLFYCEFEKKLSGNTLRAYRSDMRLLLKFIVRTKKIKTLRRVKKQVLKSYFMEIVKMYKVKTVKRKIASLKAFYTYLEFEEKITKNPMKKIKLDLKDAFMLPKTIELNDLKNIYITLYKLRTAEQRNHGFKYGEILRDLTVIELLFTTGLRINELCSLKKENIGIGFSFLKIKGKGGRERLIHICSNDIIDLLKEYRLLNENCINESGFFFINKLGNRLSENSVRNSIKKYVKLSNIKKNITPHMFRHTFATSLLEQGVDIRYIQHLLGHSSITTTQIYTHVSDIKLKEILATAHHRNNLFRSDLIHEHY